MKKILIAGHDAVTQNYQTAFANLGILTGFLDHSYQKFLSEPDSHIIFSAPQTDTGNPKITSAKTSEIFHKATPLDSYDGLVLPGGGDIAPLLFGKANKGSRNIDEGLDRLQLWLLQQFVQMNKPVLGICKGMQLINIYFGGTLIQDLPKQSLNIHAGRNDCELYINRNDCESHTNSNDCESLTDRNLRTSPIRNTCDKIHPTKATLSSFVGTLYGDCPVTNSAHHQAVGTVGDGLLVAQYSLDFVIEALYHKTLPVFGVQWHPERMAGNFKKPEMHDGSLLLHYFKTLL